MRTGAKLGGTNEPFTWEDCRGDGEMVYTWEGGIYADIGLTHYLYIYGTYLKWYNYPYMSEQLNINIGDDLSQIEEEKLRAWAVENQTEMNCGDKDEYKVIQEVSLYLFRIAMSLPITNPIVGNIG